MRRRIGVFGVAVAATTLVADCGSSTTTARPITFAIDHRAEPAFDPVDVKLSVHKPGEQMTVTSTATDAKGRTWTGVGHYTPDKSGTVDLATQASTGGTYSGIDGSGLLWSANPPAGSTATGFAPQEARSFSVTLTAAGPGSVTSTALLTRILQAPGVTEQTFTIARDKVVGKLFLPSGSSSAHSRPALVLIGGSEGGESQDTVASILASEGFPALSVAYFDAPSLPATLTNISLEYFQQAGEDLAGEPGVDRAHILIEGASRGSEAALQAAQYFPDVFHGAIVTSPSAKAGPSFPNYTGSAWTLHGTPIPSGTTIPVDHISGPVLAFAGQDDDLREWESAISAANISTELDAAHNPFPHKATVYPQAGHGVDGEATFPAMTTMTLPMTGQKLMLGGTRQANAQGQADAWSQILSLLKSLTS